IGLASLAVQARAELAEEHSQMATDGDGSLLFPMNPAHLRPSKVEAGASMVRHTRESVLDHTAQAGDRIDSSVSDDFEEAGILVDLGAGAGLGISHEIQYHKVTTSLDGQRAATDKVELAKTENTQARIAVELTKEFKAAVDLRLLQKKATVYGDPFLGSDKTT